MIVQIQRLDKGLPLPKYARPGDAGMEPQRGLSEDDRVFCRAVDGAVRADALSSGYLWAIASLLVCFGYPSRPISVELVELRIGVSVSRPRPDVIDDRFALAIAVGENCAEKLEANVIIENVVLNANRYELKDIQIFSDRQIVFCSLLVSAKDFRRV